MDKLSRLLVRRLEHIARREARRNAHRNGLLEVKLIEVGGHLLRRYAPAFDTRRLSGDLEQDLAWLRRNFGGYLAPPPEPSDIGVTEKGPAASILRLSSAYRHSVPGGPAPDIDHARHAYAVSLIGRAGRPPLISNIVAALVLARAIRTCRVPVSTVARVAMMPAPIVSLHAGVAGFERAMRRLIEIPGFIPGEVLCGIDGDFVYDDGAFAASPGTCRTYIQFIGDSVHRLGSALQRRLVNVLSRDYPVVAIAENAEHIPPAIKISADLNLAMGTLDYPFVQTMIETTHGADGLAALVEWSRGYDAHYLTIDDVILAFRPGRSAPEVLAVLAALTERNRIAAVRDDDDDDDESDGAKARKAWKASREAQAAASEKTSSDKSGSDSSSGRWKRDKPSGAEVIQPEPLNEADGTGSPRLTVEALSGYGKARDWALDLKADLVDYREARLAWSEMSTKLLLSGPPGTGKTTFARALCNSLQIPLVVTSVSTWLQGGHLSDVIDKMAKTFAEARALAPSILFIDEIDGIGKRQPAEREYADYWNTVVNKALELLDGAVKSEGLIIVGATNRPDDIDDAIKRSGRLETHIEIPRPDITTLADIFAHHLGDDVTSLIAEAGSITAGAAEHAPEAQDGTSNERSEPDRYRDDKDKGDRSPDDNRKGASK
ncbi:MAG TPA: AAA family ATPase [Rhizobium sp.]|nr:AAA family ATPase [Rhizobium sp.]